MYKVLLFDADGTLLDFKESERVGLTRIFAERNIKFSDAMRQYYLELNDKLWKDFELGKIKKDEIMDVRFQMVFDKFHMKRNGHEFEAAYRQQLNQGAHTIANALSMCQKLSEHYPLYIISNGVSQTQRKRLQASGLARYFKDIFVSEEVGYQKPQTGFFDHVLQTMDVAKEDILVIGDSLSSDIQGANFAGIDSCWFNPEHIINHTQATPTYEIDHLEQLWNIL